MTFMRLFLARHLVLVLNRTERQLRRAYDYLVDAENP